jgi:hypothetical protein
MRERKREGRGNEFPLMVWGVLGLGVALEVYFIGFIIEIIKKHSAERFSVETQSARELFRMPSDTSRRGSLPFIAECIAADSGESGLFKEKKGGNVLREFTMPEDSLEKAKICFYAKVDALELRGDKELFKQIFSKRLKEITEDAAPLNSDQIANLAKKINFVEVGISSKSLNPTAGTGYAVIRRVGFFCNTGSFQMMFDPNHKYTEQHFKLIANNFLTNALGTVPNERRRMGRRHA